MSLDLAQIGALIYPIMLTQQAGEISESKASELLNLNIESYRDAKAAAIKAILDMLESLPSPLILLLEGTKDSRSSSTKNA